MLEKLQWHIDFLERNSGPYWIAMFGIFAGGLFLFLFPKFMEFLYHFQWLYGYHPFQVLIEQNYKFLQWVYFGTPLVIIIYFAHKAYKAYMNNYRKKMG